MDVKIKTDECNFKYRVSGILIKDGKVLTVRMCKNSFYCLPGGHVEIGESSEEAIKREMREETGFDVKDVQIIAVVENFFSSKINKHMHEIGFYYLIDATNIDISINNYSITEHDKDGDIELEFKWIDIAEINKISFQPEFLKEKIRNNDYTFIHCIIGK